MEKAKVRPAVGTTAAAASITAATARSAGHAAKATSMNAAALMTSHAAAAVADRDESAVASSVAAPFSVPPQPYNAALQQEAAAFLAQEHAAAASLAITAHAVSVRHHNSAQSPRDDAVAKTLAHELDVGGAGERVAYPATAVSPPDGDTAAATLNPCTCSTSVFDGWLRAVVVSIPGPADALSNQHPHTHAAGGHGASAALSSNTAALVTFADPSQQQQQQQRTISREHALYAALELLEAAARLLQRRLALSYGQDRLLQAYYCALEEDIDTSAAGGETATTAAAATAVRELKPTVFHRGLRTRKREGPLQHYSAEQMELETRLDKVFYVLRKLEEIEGLSNSILIEGREATHGTAGAGRAAKAETSLLRRGSHVRMDKESDSDLDSLQNDDAGGLESSRNDNNNTNANSANASPDGTGPSRRLVAIERRVRRMRSQLNLPLSPAEITSRLRNELILSFSARVLALREPAPFTPETHSTSELRGEDKHYLRNADDNSANSGASGAYNNNNNNSSSNFMATAPAQDHHTHSISAFVEWYVQHIMDPPAMSQLLSIVPHEYVVTTSCRLVYACEAHASLRASRALPDLGAVLLRAVTEGRADAMSQLILSSSVSYGSALAHALHRPTCFYAGLVGGQLSVVGRLVDQQCWDAEALHVLLFLGAPWGRASATEGCHSYQKTMLRRVWRVLQLAERGLLEGDQESNGEDDASSISSSSDNDKGDDGVEGGASRAYRSNSLDSSSSGSGEKDAGTLGRGTGSVSRSAAAVAVAVLQEAGLLDNTAGADGASLLQTVSALFATVPPATTAAAAEAVVVSASSPVHGRPSTGRNSGGGFYEVRESLGGSPSSLRGNASSFLQNTAAAAAVSTGAVVVPASAAPLPAFLDGGLQKLRLLAAARSGMLQYEAYQQDAQWAALLREQQQQSARPLALRHRNSRGVAGSGHAAAREDVTAGAAPLHHDGDTDNESTSESTFARVLQHGQLDALSPAAACPVRCLMCPGFSTPSLQRVDALSYGPLQPTTPALAAATLEEIPMVLADEEGEVNESVDGRMAVSDEDNDEGSVNGGAVKGRTGGSTSHSVDRAGATETEERPVRALLLRADTAIEQAPEAWQAYWWPASAAGALKATTAPPASGDAASGAREGYRASRHKWRRSCVRLQSQCPSRYSAAYAVEEYMQAMLSAKQRRARRIFYGVDPAVAAELDSLAAADRDLHTEAEETAEEVEDDEHARNVASGDVRDVLRHSVRAGHAGKGIIGVGSPGAGSGAAAGHRPLAMMRSTNQPPSPRTVYFEVHLSLNYLLALYDFTEPLPLPSNAAEVTRRAVSGNSVVVGLCDEALAATANGCTRGPQQPYPVAHLGHTCDPAVLRGGNQAPTTTNSAGVSLTVLAHHTRSVSPSASSSCESALSGCEEVEVIYVAAWQHRRNVASLLLSDKDTPVYLRVEVPRHRPVSYKTAAKKRENELGSLGEDDDEDVEKQMELEETDAMRTLADVGPSPTTTNTADHVSHAHESPLSPTATFLPTVTVVSVQDVRRAATECYQQHQEQHQQQRGTHTELSSLAMHAATVVVGLSYTSATDTVRLRLNNYVYPGELHFGIGAASPPQDRRDSSGAYPSGSLPARLYPAATLSLDEHGWERWYRHQTQLWARSRQRRATMATSAASTNAAASASASAAGLGGSVAISNAVVKFAFEPSHLLYGPPLLLLSPSGATLPHLAANTKATAPMNTTRATHSGVSSPPPSTLHRRSRGELVSLLDASCKFTQLLHVLSNVAALAGLTSSQGTPFQPPSSLAMKTGGDGGKREAVPPGFGEGGFAKSTFGAMSSPSSSSAVPFFGSRDRRVRDALLSVQELLNAPAADGAIFYSPVRVYRHSSHCPPQDLYPLPPPPPTKQLDGPASGNGGGGAANTTAGSGADGAGAAPAQPGRRQLGAGLSAQATRTTATAGHLSWHEIIPENARLTPLCAALASRQPAMAYAICTHPLTAFCDLGNEAQNRVQQQQRRTALYAACALGYAEVLAVLLERIPVEELLSYFGLVIEGEARAALQQTYTRAETLFLRNYRLNTLSASTATAAAVTAGTAHSSSSTRDQGKPQMVRGDGLQNNGCGAATSYTAAALSGASLNTARAFSTNECQRGLLDVSSIYSTTRTLYTPLHVALLGVIRESDDEEGEDEGEDVNGLSEGSGLDGFNETGMGTVYSSSTTDPHNAAAAGSLAEASSPLLSSCSFAALAERGLRRQTACATLLLNCLYDLLLVAPNNNSTTNSSGSKDAAAATTKATTTTAARTAAASPPAAQEETNKGTSTKGHEEGLAASAAGEKQIHSAGAELLVSALNLQSRAGETALLLAVRHNNCRVATRLLRLGAQAACMDRVTHLFTLELACANRCSPMAEALLRGPTSPYAASPVLLNHAGIATALCWCAINNMHTVLEMLLRCDGVDVSIGFEGSTPLHLAITFGSEEAALALLSGTQPKTSLSVGAAGANTTDTTDRPKSRRTVNPIVKGNNAKPPQTSAERLGALPGTKAAARASPHTSPGGAASAFSPLGSGTTHNKNNNPDAHHGTNGLNDALVPHEKPVMDVNVPHERTRCTALHLACERGQLRVVRALLQQWHAQLNVAAANTNYTPLLSALANGREDAALRVLEYSKDELRRGRAVLDLTAIDQNGDTALHLAARRGLVMAMEYMLVQFCEEEVTRLAQLHPQLRTSPAFLSATCMVPLHAVNKQGKSALLVAVQYDQADAAEVLVSTLIDRRDGDGEVPSHEISRDGESSAKNNNNSASADGARSGGGHADGAVATTTTATTSSLFGGPLIDGTCMALHQAFKKRLYTVVDLMLSADAASAHIFPASQAFRDAVQQRAEERRGNRARTARVATGDSNDPKNEKNNNNNSGFPHAAHRGGGRSRASGQNRSSFVRLLLTRAAGPTISPSGALQLLLGGFVVPELCVYLSDVAAESAVLGVQHGTAMAHAELLMGFLQEHADLVVAPTRMVGFCRDVWSCLQGWMRSRAAAAQAQLQQQQQQKLESEAKARKRKSIVSFPNAAAASVAKPRGSTATPSAASRKRTEMLEEKREPAMLWLCRALLPTTATASAATAASAKGRKSRGGSSTIKGSGSISSGDYSSEGKNNRQGAEVREGDVEAQKHGEALRSALNRKSLSLDIARAIRLYGSTAGGSRAIEEIEGLVRAYVTARANARARQMRRRRGSGRSQNTPSPAPQTVSSLHSSTSDTNEDKNDKAAKSNEGEAAAVAHAEESDTDGAASTTEASVIEGSMTSAAAIIANSEADVYKEIIGNEVLFTTPIGFTVLQLAAALGLSEVTAFLVEQYKLDPLYAPAQDLYAEMELDAAMAGGNSNSPLPGSRVMAGGTRASVVAASAASSPLFASLNAAVTAAAIAATGRDAEDAQLRVLNAYTVRAVAHLNVNASASGGGATRDDGVGRLSGEAAAHGAGRASMKSTARRGAEDGTGSSSSGGSGDGGSSCTWFFWTPYRLAVRTGSVEVVRTLLRAAEGPEKVGLVAKKKSAIRLPDKRKHQQRAEGDHAAKEAFQLTASQPRLAGPAAHNSCSRIVDFKEPPWVDPFQRTALQERVAVIAGATGAAAPSTAASAGSEASAAGSPTVSAGAAPLPFTGSRGQVRSALAAAAEMVGLLLRHGAQPNGLFDSTGCDAWMLALSGGNSGSSGVTSGPGSFAQRSGASASGGGGGGGGASNSNNSGAEEHSGTGGLPMTPFGGSGVESCLSLLLRYHTPLLGQAPVLSARVPFTHVFPTTANATDQTDTSFEEQLMQHHNALLRKWKRLACMRGSSSSSATREKFAMMRHHFVASAAAAAAADAYTAHAEPADEGDFVFDIAEALSEAYRSAMQSGGSGGGGGAAHALSPPQPTHSSSHGASPQLDDLSMSNLHEPAFAAFTPFGHLDVDTVSAPSPSFRPPYAMAATGGPNGAVAVLSPAEHTIPSSQLWRDDDNPLSDQIRPRSGAAAAANAECCREKLIATLRLCYRVVLVFLCIDHAPQQLLRLLHVYTPQVIPVRARHPFSGDTVVTRLLRKARERLLTSGATPTEHEVGDMMSRVMDGVSRLNLSGRPDPAQPTNAADPSLALSQQRAYRDPTEDPGASILIHTSLALIQLLPRLGDAAAIAIAVAADPSECAMLQTMLFQPSFDDETALSLAARLAHVPLISAMVQSAASPLMLDDIAQTKVDWNGSSKRSSRFASRRPSRDPQLDAHGGDGGALSAAADSPVSTFSLATNLTDAVVRVLLATRVYYPAHEITTVRILLHCMPDEPARLDFLRWVYPNIHPLPALQLAMDHVDVAAHFLTTSDCMNALWTNLLYTHFTQQLDTVVHASSKAWNALLKVVLPGAPAVPIYLVLRGALRTRSDGDTAGTESVRRFSEVETRTTSAASFRSANTSALVKRKSSHRAKKAELTNWSYLVRRTTIFLQLMAMSVAETLMGKSVNGGAAHPGTSPATGKGLLRRGPNATPREGKDGAESGGGGGGGGSGNGTTTATATRGLAGTLLLDTLELAVRFDDKEVLALLMQLRLPEVVIKYVHQVQQQQAASNANFPVSLAAQAANARAIESANAVITGSYPSFAGVRTMTQASGILDRLQRQLWREAIQERHLDLIAVLAGAVHTLRALYAARYADVASLLTPMRYDRIDAKTGNPEGVVSVGARGTGDGGAAHTPSTSLPSPSTEPGASIASIGVLSPVDPFNATANRNAKRLPATGTARLGGAVSPTHPEAVGPAALSETAAVAATASAAGGREADVHSHTNAKASPRSPAQLEAEEEQRFMESCRQNDRLAPREERRRRVTMVTWGIGGSSCPVDLPPGRGSLSAAVVDGDVQRAAGVSDEGEEEEDDNNNNSNNQVAELAGNVKARSSEEVQQEKKPLRQGDAGADRRTTPPASLLSPVPSRLPPPPFPSVQANHTSGASTAADHVVKDTTTSSKLMPSKPVANGATTAQARGRKVGPAAAPPGNAAATRVHVPALHLPTSPTAAPTPPPARVARPVYFMYLQLDWAMFSTRLLHSPQPSTATVDTILFLMEHRCALSVPVLDLFLSGLSVTASRFATAAKGNEGEASQQGFANDADDLANATARQRSYANFSSAGDDAQQTSTVHLTLGYRTRRHRDTLLHLLVLHDQCQLAEYYLEYCYFFFVSHQVDPEPKNGRPGRFPIHEQLRRQEQQQQSSGDGLDRTDRPGQGRRRTTVSPTSTGTGAAATAAFPHTPVAFLRMMLRVNAHGLTAFDYAHSPAMLQLLEWYGCVPPTYRPNPRLFRQVLRSRNEGTKSESGDGARRASDGAASDAVDDVTSWALVGDDDEEIDSNGEGETKEGRERKATTQQQKQKRQRALLHFFPVPRLVLATDNFVTLLDPTGAELASTAPRALTAGTPTASDPPITASAASLSASRSRNEPSKTNIDRSTGEGNADVDELTTGAPDLQRSDRQQPQQQQRASRHLTALLTTEKKQMQLAQRRREQQEAAKAMLFEQVAVQPLLAARQSAAGGASGKAGKALAATASDTAAGRRRGPANPPYLSRVITNNMRERWAAQRHPPVSENVLWHNALEAQRQSFIAAVSAARSNNTGSVARGSRDEARKGILPILLSEEVSLLHLGLCTFDDELVSLYGELHASSSSAAQQQQQQQRLQDWQKESMKEGRGVTGSNSKGTQRTGASVAQEAQLSAYNRMLLPPMLTGKTGSSDQQQQQQQAEASNKKNSVKESGVGKEAEPKKVHFGSRDAKLSISTAAPLTTTFPPPNARNSSITVTAAAAAPSPPPPRLSHTDIIFLLECQQFIVFPLALPNVSDDDFSLDTTTANNNIGRSGGNTAADSYVVAAAAGSGRALEDQQQQQSSTNGSTVGVAAALHGPLATSAVIERCTGGEGSPADGRRKAPSRNSTTTTTTTASLRPNGGSGNGGGPAARARGRTEHANPASDVPLLRLLFTRQAATLTDLVDVAPRRYDVALLVSLTPMQLSGAANSTGGAGSGTRGGTGDAAAVSMRALAERLSSTQFKQFASRLVGPAAGGNGGGGRGRGSMSTTAAAVAAALHPVVETVPVLHVPPFTATENSTPGAALRSAATHHDGLTSPHETGTVPSTAGAAGGAAATAVASTSTATSTTVPIAMAARMEEWVARRWPAQRKPVPAKKAVAATAATSLHSPRAPSARSRVAGSTLDADKNIALNSSDYSSLNTTLPPPSVLDQISPVGGVATATQQTLMRALLKRFSAATGAQLSEQMGLLVAPNYDVEEVGDAAAAQRGIAAKDNTPPQKKKLRR